MQAAKISKISSCRNAVSFLTSHDIARTEFFIANTIRNMPFGLALGSKCIFDVVSSMTRIFVKYPEWVGRCCFAH